MAIPLSHLAGVRLTFFQDSILWSLLAELIYYAGYPALRWLQLRQGNWWGLLAISFVLALGVAATNPGAGNYPVFGSALNWLLGLPCWLAGCALAESIRTGPVREVSAGSIWRWRLVVFGAAWSCSVLRYHSPLGYPWTLNFFALLVACWLYHEIHFRRKVPPPSWLERAGLGSYSLYLVHVPAGVWFAVLFPVRPGGEIVRWVALICFVLLICYVFYLLVERPSHYLAKRAGRRMMPGEAAIAAVE